MKIILSFLVFLFGVMFGYGWQKYHHLILVGNLKQTINTNQQRIDDMGQRITALQDEIIIEEIVQKVIICESQGRYNARGDGGRSFGPAQFQKKTFDWMKARANRPYLNWLNSEHQLWLLKWAIKNGMAERHWKIC